MTITEQKSRETILALLAEDNRVAIVGCGTCARLCETGGEPQVRAMAEVLREQGKEVIAALTPTEACHATDTPTLLREHRDEIDSADCVLAMCCDSGAKVIAEAVSPKPVRSALRKPETEASAV